jgi:hypothetical protein
MISKDTPIIEDSNSKTYIIDSKGNEIPANKFESTKIITEIDLEKLVPIDSSNDIN